MNERDTRGYLYAAVPVLRPLGPSEQDIRFIITLQNPFQSYPIPLECHRDSGMRHSFTKANKCRWGINLLRDTGSQGNNVGTTKRNRRRTKMRVLQRHGLGEL